MELKGTVGPWWQYTLPSPIPVFIFYLNIFYNNISRFFVFVKKRKKMQKKYVFIRGNNVSEEQQGSV